MKLKKFNNFNEKINFDNHNSFKNKLKDLISDNETIDKILSLIPDNVILPEYYVGDNVKRIDDGQVVKITDLHWKQGHGYIYYYYDKEFNDEVYGYEDDFKKID